MYSQYVTVPDGPKITRLHINGDDSMSDHTVETNLPCVYKRRNCWYHGAYSVPSHYLNLCSLVVNWDLTNKLQ